MKEQSLVSVSLMTYNQQEFIRESIESVLDQDYDNLEIVIGDDCSKDDTWEIVQEHRRNYPDKIKAFRNEQNLGITGNSNELLKRCTGKYIAIFAGDDVMLPKKISKQVEVMERDESVVLCYHDIEVFNSENGKTLRFWNHGPSSYLPIAGDAEKVAIEVIEQGTSFMAALSIMVRKDALPATGFDPRIPSASDWLMWIEILAAGGPTKKVEYIPNVLARYRRHGSNITRIENRDDQLVTLAIVESKYPRFVFNVHKWYLKFHYYCGMRMICNNDLSNGRNVMLLSLRSGWVSWKIFYWLAASYLPVLLLLRRFQTGRERRHLR